MGGEQNPKMDRLVIYLPTEEKKRVQDLARREHRTDSDQGRHMLQLADKIESAVPGLWDDPLLTLYWALHHSEEYKAFRKAFFERFTTP